MTREEGLAISEAAMDAVSYAEEQFEDPQLISVAVVLTVVDAQGEEHVATRSWAR